VKSAMGYPAYYPVHDVKIETPLKAVLMDLDGTTVHSEHFWIWIIEKTTASLRGVHAIAWHKGFSLRVEKPRCENWTRHLRPL